VLAAAIISSTFLAGEAEAQLNVTLSGTAGSSIITATFSGSTTATGAYGGLVGGLGWSFIPTTFNPFPPAITGGDFGVFNFTSGSATITINGTNQSMTGIFLQDSSNSPTPGQERFGTTGFSYGPIFVGEVFQWAGTATFNISGKGLTFGNLNPGTTGAIPDDLAGISGSLTIVPEPSSLALILVSGLALLPRLRQRARNGAA